MQLRNLLGFTAALSLFTAPALAQNGSLLDQLKAEPNFSTLVVALETAGLDGVFAAPGDLTLFAPDNDAFAKIDPADLNALLADVPALADVLIYHVLPGTVLSPTVIAGGKTATLQGKKVSYGVGANGAFVNGSLITNVDNLATNGVFHRIDTVLSTADAPATIVDRLELNGNFTTLATALDLANLTATLDGPGPFTLFAPTNGAFDRLPAGVLDALLRDPAGALTDVLLGHVAQGEVFAADVASQPTGTTLSGVEVLFNVTDFGPFVNEAYLVFTDVPTDNGVIHVIDVVLTEQPTIEDFVLARPHFATLAAALEIGGLIGALDAPGALTLFAPIERAFLRLPDGVLAGLIAAPADLANVLLYHVLPVELLAADVLSQPSAATLLGPDVQFSLQNSNAFVNQAELLATDIRLANGTLHILRDVLIPPGL